MQSITSSVEGSEAVNSHKILCFDHPSGPKQNKKQEEGMGNDTFQVTASEQPLYSAVHNVLP